VSHEIERGPRRGVRALLWTLAAAATLWTSSAHAQSELERRWSDERYVLHGGIAAGAVLGAILVENLATEPGAPPRWISVPGFEASVSLRMSTGAAAWSDRMLTLSVVTPLLLHVGDGVDRQFTNHSFIHIETLTLQVLLNSTIKHIARRARPYTHNPDPRVREKRDEEGHDAVLSFYSGHAGMAFASAVSGAYLFGAKSPDSRAHALAWFVSMFSASAAAHLRVAAGRHYYTDVWTGALMGAALGVALPYAHGNRYRPDGWDVAAMVSGLTGGVLLAFLPAWPASVDLPWPAPETRLRLSPMVGAQGMGLSLDGRL